ncbi:MAG: iron uptake porin, partial [Cyanophyceae cyanobacterium]
MANVKGQLKQWRLKQWRSPRRLFTINALVALGWVGCGAPAIAQPAEFFEAMTMPDAVRMGDAETYTVSAADNTTTTSAGVSPAGVNPATPAPTPPSARANEAVPVLAQIDGPVTSVSDLTDVDPTHWAFQALRSLIERYGCVSGYGDGTFRGDRALSRYEFAAALNTCLDQIGEQIEAATQDGVREDDLATVRRLQQEFRQELADLDAQVGTLEQRVEALENQQFSTTAVLGGEVIFGLTGAAA